MPPIRCSFHAGIPVRVFSSSGHGQSILHPVRLIQLCLIGIVGLVSTPVLGNGPEVGRDAGTIFPVKSDRVQLVSERVDVHLPRQWDDGYVECVYVLRNLDGSPQDFEMAFVTNPPFAPFGKEFRRHYEEASFLVHQDGEPVALRYMPIAEGRWSELIRNPPVQLPVWRIVLRPWETATLEMTYKISWSGGSDGGHSTRSFTYHARPAALWAGSIERASIHFHLGTLATTLLECHPHLGRCFDYAIEPPGYRWRDEGMTWEFTDWEPATDFTFRYDIHRDERGRLVTP